MLESQIITDEKLPNIHPGEVLKEEFLSPMNVSAYRLAKEINVPETRISEIIRGKRSITANTTKVWITRSGKCLLANNASKIPDRVLRDLMAVIEARSGEVVKKWYEFHKEISYYC